jgi:hypothetical protein
VTFFVRKGLATGPIRFGVTPRRTLDSIDQEAGLSTGASGEFLRRRGGGFFFSDERTVASPTLPIAASITRVPFWKSVLDGTSRGYGFLAMLVFGAILVLLGFAVIGRKGPQGWVEVILGIILIAVPLVLTAQRRKQIREQEEKERAAREAEEARNRQMLSAYTAALDRLTRDKDEAAIDEVRRERAALTLPYEIWSAAAKRAVLGLGFDHLARVGTARAREVSDWMSRASQAAGLSAADEVGTKHDFYRNLVWHLLADDRIGDPQAEELKTVRKGFDIWDRDVPVEAKAAEEFLRLRGVTNRSLPRAQCGVPLKFQEYCVHHARGVLMNAKMDKKARRQVWTEGPPCDLYITNRRIIVSAKKPLDVPLPRVFDVDVDIDDNVLIIRTADPKKPISMRVEDPVYTASLVDIATTIDERPKGFA